MPILSQLFESLFLSAEVFSNCSDSCFEIELMLLSLWFSIIGRRVMDILSFFFINPWYTSLVEVAFELGLLLPADDCTSPLSVNELRLDHLRYTALVLQKFDPHSY